MLRRLALWALQWTDELISHAKELGARADRRWYELYMDLSYRLDPGRLDPPP